MKPKKNTDSFAIVPVTSDAKCSWYHVWTEGERVCRCGKRYRNVAKRLDDPVANG